MGCHFLLQCMKVKSQSEVAQLCPTLRNPMDCSLPGSSVHGIFQARVLEWGAIAFSISDTCCTFIIDCHYFPLWGFPGGSVVKNPPAMWETWVRSLGWKIPWRRERLPTPVFWPGEFHGLYSPWGRKESDTTERLSLSLYLSQ